MAPLEWLTPDRLTSWLERYGALLYFALGLGALYVGLTDPGEFAVLGVDGFVWLGVCWMLFAVSVWAARRFRVEGPERT